jgi:hypothetical protein
MCTQSLRIAATFALTLYISTPVAFAANLPAGQLPSRVRPGETLIKKSSFWGLPYPYGFTWQHPCYGWRSAVTGYGHHHWYRTAIRRRDWSCNRPL